MSYVCQICHKSNVAGHSKKHKRGVAGKRWKFRAQVTPRLFKINLQKKTVVVNGEVKQMRLCAKCIKRIRNFGEIGDYKNISFSGASKA
jgi:ribosomal protein L28